MAAEKSARIFPDNLAAARARIAELEAEIARLRKPRLAPQAAREPEDRSLFEAIPQVAFVAAPDGMIETLNRCWEEYCGVPADQSLGLNWLAEIHPGDASEFKSHWLQCVHSGECFEREYRLRNRLGDYRWHLAHSVPVRSTTGGILRWIGTSTDIHDRKTRELSLQASEERFRLAFRAVEGVVYDWYPQTGVVSRSGSLQKIIGIPVEAAEPTEAWWQERVHPEDVAASTLHVIGRLAPDQANFETEFRIRHAAGHWVHVSDRGFVIRDENGVPIRVVGTSQDVTEQRRLERELKASNEQLKFQSDILATTNDAVIALDPNLCIRYCNAAAEKMYGVRLADVVGKPLPAMHGYAFLAPEDEQRTIKDLTERGSWKGEYIHILHNGTQLVVHSTVNVLAPESGGGMVAVIRDVTGRKQAEIQKQNQASQLARANEDLLHFAYAVSHDLQAPVRTIVAFSQMLALTSKAALDDKSSQLLAYLVAAGARMSTMIRDLLEFAQVAGGPVQFSESVSLEHVLETALANLASAIEETGAAITHDPLPNVAGDAGQFAQLFQNLIANSLKYRKPDTPPSIRISLQQNAGETVVSVHDNGIGFEPHHSQRIFGVFQRLHGEQFAGTGIGLTICKRIVERRGGRIWAEGRPGEGASFSFSIPDSIEAIPAAPPMDWDRVHTALEHHPPEETSVPASHFDELFKTLDLAQAIVRRLDGTILIWTKGAERLFGWTASEAVGKQLHELLRTELPIPLAELEATLLRSGEWTGELKACKRDGGVVWLATLKVLYRDGSGRPQSVMEVHNDITALKDAQAALQRSSEQRDLALRAANMGVWCWDSQSGVVVWSETLERMLGMEPGSFEGTYEAVRRRLHPEDRQPLQDRIANAFQNGPDYVIENRFLHNNGSFCWVRGQGRVVFDENNQPAGLVGVVWDITERKQSEADWQFLLDLSAKFPLSSDRGRLAGTAVAETAKYLGVLRCVYIEIDRPGNRLLRVADYNTAGASNTGSSPLDSYDGILAEMENGRFVAVSDVAVDPRTAENCEAAYLSLGTRAFLSVPLYRDGAFVACISVTSGDIRIWQEREIALLRCIAERLWPAMENARLLQEARERQEQFEATFEQAAVGMAQVGLDGRFLRVNQRFCQITGYSYEELLAARFQDITHPDDLAADLRAYQALQQGETQSYSIEKRYFHKTGSLVWINLTVSLVGDSSGVPKYAISVIEDITERKKTAQEALEYADRLAIATSAAQLGVFVWSALSDSTSWENQRVYEIFGRTREAGPLGDTEFLEKVLHPHDMVAFQSAMAEAMLPGHLLHTTVRIRRADGELRWIEASGRFDLDAAGTPLRLTGVLADVTDRIEAERLLRDRTSVLDRMEEAVRQSEERYRLAEWATNDGLWDWNPITDDCYFSPRFKALLGLEEDELESKAAAVFERLHPDDAPSLFEAVRLNFEERRPYDVEMRMRLKNGQYRWFHTRGQAIRDQAGNVTRMIGSISDIHDRNTSIQILRRNQEVLEESERKFRELAETLPELLWVADSQGGIVYYNPQWRTYTGLAEGEGLADSWVSIVHPDDIGHLFKTWQTSLAHAQHYECEARIRRHDGVYRWFLNRAEPVRNAEGEIAKWIGTSLDIHERKLTEQALRHSNEDLEQFAYAASHDLQESMRTVSIYSQLIVRRCDGGGPDTARFAAYLVNATTRMDSLLRGILDYWRLAEPVEGTSACDSEGILQTALENLQGATVTHDVLPRVACPAGLMLQLFENLLGNAVKYRAARPLEIHISATAEGRYWKFSIADNGIGIKPEYLKKIFGMFKRLHRDEYPGVGIGLAICKRIVERHGGRIWAESQPGHGATFHFTLPAAEKPPN